MENLVVDEYEGWYVAIFDFPGEYLNSHIPDEKDAILKSEGELVNIM